MKLNIVEEIQKLCDIYNMTAQDISPNITWKDKITVTCNICNTTTVISVKQFLRPHPARTGTVCPVCREHEKFLQELNKLYGTNPYTFITPFLGYNKPITVLCNECKSKENYKKASNLLLNAKLPEGCHPCKQCTYNRIYKKDPIELENYMIKNFGSYDYILLEPEKYAGLYSTKKLKFRCTICGHEFSTTVQNITHPSNGIHYCSVCNKKERTLERMPYKERCLLVTEGKIEPIEEYIDSKTPIKHKCNICGYGSDGEWLKLPVKNTTRNSGCPKCNNIVSQSRAEIEIYKLICENYTGTIEQQNRSVLPDNKEIDIYLPEEKLGIEVDGLYWHSEQYKGKKYHIDKTEAATAVGIRLIHIFDDEWYQHKDITTKKILNIIGNTADSSVYARKCIICDISKQEKLKFLLNNHIQGNDRSTIAKGLLYNNELVAVMTFTKPRISLGNKTSATGLYELSRYATSKHVIGGFSKLLSHVCREHTEITDILTYADVRYSSESSNVYIANGFTLDHISSPNYWYFDSHSSATTAVRKHRYSFRKQALEARFPKVYDPTLTEFEIMDKTTYRRIWDCGNLVYIKQNIYNILK